MANAHETINSGASKCLTGASERLKLRLKTMVIKRTDIEQLVDTLWKDQAKYPQVMQCWTCETRLPLEEVKFDWPVGPYSFYFPDVPAYNCSRCEKIYFPEPVREALSRCIEYELEELKPEAPPRNPKAVDFARSWSELTR